MAGRKKQTSHVVGFYGWTKPNFSTVVRTNKRFLENYHGAMLYVHYELTANDLKKEVIKFLKHIDSKHPFLDRIKGMNENRFAVIGKYIYILNHGGELPDSIAPTVMPALGKIIDEEEAKVSKAAKEAAYISEKNGTDKIPDESSKPSISIQDRLRERAKEIAGEVEGWIDEFIMDKKTPVKTVEEFVSLFKANDLKGPHMKYIKEAFSRRADHMLEVVESKDKDLIEGYSNFTKPELKKFSLFYQNLMKATDMLQEAAKVVRAPRKKKPVSQEKMVSKLKYKKEDSSLGIVSLNPVHIIGAKEVWTYNTKTRKLAQFKSMDDRGILVKGASLDNISVDSVEKTLRKPAETLAEFKKSSKVKLRTFMKDIGTVDVVPGGRLSEHHIILRIDK